MSSSRTITFEHNSAAFNREVSAFLRALPERAVEPAVRKVAFDVVAETVMAITTGVDNTPKRVDTGRYRAGWQVGLRRAKATGQGHATSIEVTNNVEYGPFVEFGTVHMAAGNHLTRALAVVRRDISAARGGAKTLLERIADLWSGK